MTRVKICGISSYEEAEMAAAAGTWAIGQVFAPSSRRIHPQLAAAINRQVGTRLCKVGVFVDEVPQVVNEIAAQCGLDLVQLHGSESPEYVRQIHRPVIKAFAVRTGMPLPDPEEWPVFSFLFDAYDPQRAGGSGKSFNWDLVAGFPAPYIVAGGLTAANVGQVIVQLSPWAVDVSSGVEIAGQGKDPDKINQFIAQVMEVDRNVS